MRSTHCLDNIVKAGEAIGKRVAVWSCLDGMKSLIRAEDGQAYELSIKPARLSKFEPFRRYTKKKIGKKIKHRFI
jgi:hypothetical protein